MSAAPSPEQILALRQRSVRDAEGRHFVDGVRFVSRAVDSGARIEGMIVARDLLVGRHARRLVREQRRLGTPIREVSTREYYELSQAAEPQGLGAVVRQRWLDPSAARLRGTWVGIEEVRSHGNLGAIMRSCEAAGAAGLILIGDRTDPYDPAAVRGSMGSLFGVSLVRVGVRGFDAMKRRNRMTVVGTSSGAMRDYRTLAYRRPLVLMMGCERHGLSEAQERVCDKVVQIPMRGAVHSLNLAVATGILLYEVFNQRCPARAARAR